MLGNRTNRLGGFPSSLSSSLLGPRSVVRTHLVRSTITHVYLSKY